MGFSRTRASFRQSAEERLVFLQGAIVLTAGLLLGLLGFIDLANMLECYVVLDQAAFEGVKTAMNYPNLEPLAAAELTPSIAEADVCLVGGVAADFPCGHYRIQERVRAAFDTARSGSDWAPLVKRQTLATEFVPAGRTQSPIDNTVLVTVTVSFSGFVFRGVPLTATARGPYLMWTPGPAPAVGPSGGRVARVGRGEW